MGRGRKFELKNYILNLYTNKRQWKFFLFFIAIIIGVFSLTYTNILVKKLAHEERKKVELWAEGTRQLADISNPDQDFSFILQVIRNNNTVPVILIDEEGNINATRNLDTAKVKEDRYLQRQLTIMKEENEPIIITLPQGHKNFIYYKDSTILTQLMYFPYVQLAVITLFILVSYFAFSYSRKAEQNRVWVGLAKETAHQLGTPISSLLGWLELLRMEDNNPQLVEEVQKDLNRLQVVTDRFSKIGSQAILKPESLNEVLNSTINYLKTRVSDKVNLQYKLPENEIIIPLNISLFEWVIENVFKNAVDAMNGEGILNIDFIENEKNIILDIEDSGKGIQKAHLKTIFKPGFTTKQRGWGLGLSLSKRIIEQHHNGKIFVKSTELEKGTIIRIILPK
jgi:signal transduction histidine kinase